jgi:hypothetical protein
VSFAACRKVLGSLRIGWASRRNAERIVVGMDGA